MKKNVNLTSTLKNSLIYLSTTILEKAVGFIMLPIYASQLGSQGYGILGMIEVTIAVLNIMSKYGVAGSMNRFYFARETLAEKKRLVSTTIFIMLGITMVTCTPPMVFSDAISRLAFGTQGDRLFILVGVLAFMIDANGFVGEQYLIIQQKALLVSILSVLRLLIAISLNIYLIVVLQMGVLGVLYSHLITAIVFFFIFEGYVLVKTGLGFNRKDAKELLAFFLPLVPGYAAAFVRNNTDKIIIRTYLGLSYIGVYSMVLKFAMLLGLLVYAPFMKTWIPKRMEICEYPDGPRTISKVFTVHTTVMLFMAIMLTIQIPLIIKVLTPPEFWVSTTVAFFAVFSRVMFNSFYHLNFGLIYSKKTGKISLVLITITVVSIPVYIIFIKLFGLLGAFMAASCLYSFQAFFVYRIGKQDYIVDYDFKKLTIMFGIAIALIVLISQVRVEGTGWLITFKTQASPIIKDVLKFMSLDTFKDGKLLTILTDKLGYVVEGAVKAILAMSYLVFMVLFGIIDRQMLKLNAGKLFRRSPPKSI